MISEIASAIIIGREIGRVCDGWWGWEGGDGVSDSGSGGDK